MQVPDLNDLYQLIRKVRTSKGEKIIRLQKRVKELQEENNALIGRIQTLENALNIKNKVVWEPPYYFLQSEYAKEGPYCQYCYDNEKKLIRLIPHGRGLWQCHVCENLFRDGKYEESHINDAPDPYKDLL